MGIGLKRIAMLWSFFVLGNIPHKALADILSKNSPTLNSKSSSFEQSLLPLANIKNSYRSSFKVLEEAEHNSEIFTQGFDYEAGIFYESSGLFGKSFITKYTNISPLKHKKVAANIFAEGLVKLDKELYLLSWKTQTLFIHDADTLSLKRTLPYKGEGWGITNDGQQFIMSDGSSKLFFRNTESFDIINTVQVHDANKIYRKLNELEYAQGYIWANVWLSPYILKIRPSDGFVEKKYNLNELVQENMSQPMHTVLNGIAYDEKNDAFWVTGKLWPKRYLLKFED